MGEQYPGLKTDWPKGETAIIKTYTLSNFFFFFFATFRVMHSICTFVRITL